MASDASFDPATHFTFKDITVDDPSNPSLLKLRLKASKTDPFRKGVDIVVGVTKTVPRDRYASISSIVRKWSRVPIPLSRRQAAHEITVRRCSQGGSVHRRPM